MWGDIILVVITSCMHRTYTEGLAISAANFHRDLNIPLTRSDLSLSEIATVYGDIEVIPYISYNQAKTNTTSKWKCHVVLWLRNCKLFRRENKHRYHVWKSHTVYTVRLFHCHVSHPAHVEAWCFYHPMKKHQTATITGWMVFLVGGCYCALFTHINVKQLPNHYYWVVAHILL